MAFPKNGVVPASDISVASCGLLQVVTPESALDEDRWVRGFSQEWNTSLYSAKLWDDTDTYETTITSNPTPTYYTEIKPFFIEVEEVRSTLGFLGLDRIERLKTQLECVTQKALETELWVGAIRTAASHSNKALSSSTATVLNGGTALSPHRALALLEHTIGTTSPCGEQGVIHMTRDTAILAARDGIIVRDDKGCVNTIAGTPVVIGSGYTGVGPTGAAGAAATASNKWMYASGSVKVYIGKVDVVNDNLSQAYDVSGNQNDMRIKAIRPAAVYFGPAIHLAIRVDLTT